VLPVILQGIPGIRAELAESGHLAGQGTKMIAKTPRQTPPEGSEPLSAIQRTLRLITALVGGVSCLSMAVTLYRTWQTPMAVEGGRWVSLGVGIMVLELLLVHSGVMLPGLSSQIDPQISMKRKRLALVLVSALVSVGYEEALGKTPCTVT
jgi:hypothetical protein